MLDHCHLRNKQPTHWKTLRNTCLLHLPCWVQKGFQLWRKQTSNLGPNTRHWFCVHWHKWPPQTAKAPISPQKERWQWKWNDGVLGQFFALWRLKLGQEQLSQSCHKTKTFTFQDFPWLKLWILNDHYNQLQTFIFAKPKIKVRNNRGPIKIQITILFVANLLHQEEWMLLPIDMRLLACRCKFYTLFSVRSRMRSWDIFSLLSFVPVFLVGHGVTN